MRTVPVRYERLASTARQEARPGLPNPKGNCTVCCTCTCKSTAKIQLLFLPGNKPLNPGPLPVSTAQAGRHGRRRGEIDQLAHRDRGSNNVETEAEAGRGGLAATLRFHMSLARLVLDPGTPDIFAAVGCVSAPRSFFAAADGTGLGWWDHRVSTVDRHRRRRETARVHALLPQRGTPRCRLHGRVAPRPFLCRRRGAAPRDRTAGGRRDR